MLLLVTMVAVVAVETTLYALAVAATVLWLLSDESSYVNGQNVIISGGIDLSVGTVMMAATIMAADNTRLMPIIRSLMGVLRCLLRGGRPASPGSSSRRGGARPEPVPGRRVGW